MTPCGPIRTLSRVRDTGWMRTTTITISAGGSEREGGGQPLPFLLIQLYSYEYNQLAQESSVQMGGRIIFFEAVK